MEKINSETNNINGLSSSVKPIENKLFNTNTPLISKTLMTNLEEEKTKIDLPFPYLEYKYVNSAQNLTSANTLFDRISEKINYKNLDEIKKQKRNITNETLENGLNLEEQNIKEYYEKIEKELNKIKSGKKEKNIEENKNIKNNNAIKSKLSLNTNSQLDGDLFYYSEEEDNIKKKNEMKENIDKLKKNLNKDIKPNIDITNINNIKNKDIIGINIDEQIKKNENSNILDDIKIDKELLDNIEYGIDENGNPINLKSYYEEINNEKNNDINVENLSNNKTNKIKKPVAYIIQQEEKGKNYLIDLKGNKIPKMEDGYFNYKNDNIRLLIKDFDVQHPELRVFGARKRDTLILNDEEENIDNHKSIEIKKLIIPNNLKNKLLNRNSSFSITKRKNITTDNYFEQKRILLNKNVLNLKKNSPIIVKKNLELFRINNKQFRKWKFKEKPKTDNREIYSYNRNNKETLYRKIPPKKYNNSISINNIRNNRSNETVRRTNKILNKSVSGALYTNRENLNNSKLDNNFKKGKLNKSDYLKKMSNNNSLFNDGKGENSNSSQEIKNITCTTSRINLYKYKKINKRGGSYSCNYNRIFNLKSIINNNTEVKKNNELLEYIKEKNKNKNENIRNNDNLLLNYEKEKNNNFDKIIYNKDNIINDNKIIYNNEIKKNNNNQILNFEKENNKKDNIISYNNENANNFKIKKAKSSRYIVSTIDSISNNIKSIQNNIQQNLLKLNNKNENISNNTSNNDIIKFSVPLSSISTIYSPMNLSKEFPSYSNIYSSNNESQTNIDNKSNDNNNTDKIIKIQQNQNNKLSPVHKKFHCAVLSKEVNDIISNYTNKNKENENINNNEFKKIDIYEIKKEIKNNEKNINSFLGKTKNKINSNYINNITQRYNYITEPNNSSFNLEDNKQKIINNKKVDNCELCGCKVLKNLNDKDKNVIIKNDHNNFNQIISEEVVPFQKKLNSNIYQQQNKFHNSYKLLNTFTEPKFKCKIIDYNIKLNNKSNSITSLNQINFNSQRNNEQSNYKYSQNTFSKHNKINTNHILLRNKNFIYNYTERGNFNNNKII